MNKDILTCARVLDIIRSEFGLNNFPSNQQDIVLLSKIFDEENYTIMDDVLSIIYPEMPNEQYAVLFIKYLEFVSESLQKYNTEIINRIDFAINAGTYKLDENIEEKEEFYQSNIYYTISINLYKNGINPVNLSLYESMLMNDELICNDLKKSASELVSYISSSNEILSKSLKDLIPHCNFVSMCLDLIKEAEAIYESSKKD